MNDIHCVFFVIVLEVLQYLELDSSLIVVLFLVLDYFKSNFFLSFVVKALNSYTKRAFTQKLEDFVSEANMVTRYYLVVALVVIITMVMFLILATVNLLVN